MEKLEFPFHIADVIHRHMKGEMNEQERILLEEWLEEDSHHAEMFREFCRPGYFEEKVIVHQEFDPKVGLRKFLQGKQRLERRRSIRRWGSVAAVFIGVCGMALAIIFLNIQEPASLLSENRVLEILPAQPRATLILADGRQMLLSDSLKGQLKQGAAELSIIGGKLNYQSTETALLTYNEVVTPRGGEYQVELADGSRVWLNADSRLRYPVTFVGKQREVWLTGEAYFEVAKDRTKPFMVRTEQMDIRVLGTSFNVAAYPEENGQATLVSGKVKVMSGNHECLMQPGEQVVWNKGTLEIRQVDVGSFIAWKDQRFVFNDDSLETIIRRLERWYDVEFFIQNNSVRELRFTGNLPKYDNLDKILHKLQLTTRIHFVQKGRVIMVESDAKIQKGKGPHSY